MTNSILLSSIPTLKNRDHLIGRICTIMLLALACMYLIGSNRTTGVTAITATVMILLTVQLFYQFGFVNVILGVLFLLVGLYLPLAVISEFREFPTHTSEAWKLLGFGLGLSLLILTASGLLLYKTFMRWNFE